MKNDFVEGMEILINCKRLVENLVRETEIKIRNANMAGKNSYFLEEEKEKYLSALGQM